MKFSSLIFATAGLGKLTCLAAWHTLKIYDLTVLGLVSAAPIRVIIVSVQRQPVVAPTPLSEHVSFGHAAAGRVQSDPHWNMPVVGTPAHHKCGGGAISSKFSAMSNSLRKLFGMEVTENGSAVTITYGTPIVPTVVHDTAASRAGENYPYPHFDKNGKFHRMMHHNTPR